jgi:hypothetical protein
LSRERRNFEKVLKYLLHLSAIEIELYTLRRSKHALPRPLHALPRPLRALPRPLHALPRPFHALDNFKMGLTPAEGQKLEYFK